MLSSTDIVISYARFLQKHVINVHASIFSEINGQIMLLSRYQILTSDQYDQTVVVSGFILVSLRLA